MNEAMDVLGREHQPAGSEQVLSLMPPLCVHVKKRMIDPAQRVVFLALLKWTALVLRKSYLNDTGSALLVTCTQYYQPLEGEANSLLSRTYLSPVPSN